VTEAQLTSELTAEVDRLRRDRRSHPNRGQREYAATARSVRESGEALIDAGQAGIAGPVLRKAVDRVTRALEHLDDSSGIIGDQLRATMRTYARACTVASPSPKSLASWLVKLQCDGPGWPDVILADFAEALGPRGIAEVERQVAARAADVDPDSWSDSWAIRDLREQLAQVSGDVDRYVAVMAEHLTHPGRYQRIAQSLAGSGRTDEALGWAQRGIAEHPDHHETDELLDTLVSLMLNLGDQTGALQLRQTEFERRPLATTYDSWAATAAAAEAPNPLPHALQMLRERTTHQPNLAAELITVLQVSGHDEEAWQVATTYRRQVDRYLWVDVLARRATSHPEDIIQPYEDMIEDHVLDSRDARRYRRAVAYLPALREAYTVTGCPEAFTAYLTALRQRHKIRPAFVKTLDAGGWFGEPAEAHR
jgi:tetratricopeptide (TPR) repeat protein